jgi:uncharacterized protein
MNEPLEPSVRRWASACHLVGLLSIVLCALAPIPLLGVLLPYFVWQAGRDRHPFIDEQGREAINFQISMTIYAIAIALGLISIVFAALFVGITSNWTALIGLYTNTAAWGWYAAAAIVIAFALFMVAVILFAAIKASRGQSYRYPFTIRFLQ